MTLPDPADIPVATGHGGKRTPAPGKKIGPPFKEGEKSCTMSVTFSSKTAADKLKALAAAAGITPGALVEKKLHLRPSRKKS